LTKKLNKSVKYSNKVRRHILTEIKKLSKDPTIEFKYNFENEMINTEKGPQFTGHHKLTLTWFKILKVPKLKLRKSQKGPGAK